jgi:hypothetical protein
MPIARQRVRAAALCCGRRDPARQAIISTKDYRSVCACTHVANHQETQNLNGRSTRLSGGLGTVTRRLLNTTPPSHCALADASFWLDCSGSQCGRYRSRLSASRGHACRCPARQRRVSARCRAARASARPACCRPTPPKGEHAQSRPNSCHRQVLDGGRSSTEDRTVVRRLPSANSGGHGPGSAAITPLSHTTGCSIDLRITPWADEELLRTPAQGTKSQRAPVRVRPILYGAGESTTYVSPEGE